jgi:hypothetical protein
MKARFLFAAAVALIAVGLVLAQQPPAPAKQGGADTPSPEQVLTKWVGTWDATIHSTDRDGKPVASPAKAAVKLAYGGRWLITEFEGTFAGAPFTGQEVLGYDPVAKKYLLSWIDSAATSFAVGEGTFDPKTDVMTLTVSGRDDKTGKMTTWRQVDVWKDADHHEWTIRTTADGKEQIQMTIQYRRRK